MMKIFKQICLLFVPLLLSQHAFAYEDKDIAVVRIMDKTAGKTQLISANIGQTIKHDGLTIIARTCKKTDPFEAENFFVFLEVYTKSNERIFSGWMNRNEPGQNPLQNDTYDIWVEKCE